MWWGLILGHLERSLPLFFHQHLFGTKLACGSLEQRSAWWTPGCNWISWELEKLWLYLGWCYLLSFWSWWTPDHKNSRMHTLTTKCAINIKEVHYDIINIKEVHLNRITCCQGWNKSGRCPAPQSSASDPASTFPGPGHHIKLGTWKTCQAVKSNLIKRIVPAPSGGEFPVCRRGAEISWNVVNASDSLLQLYVSTLHTHKDNLMSGKSDSTTSAVTNKIQLPNLCHTRLDSSDFSKFCIQCCLTWSNGQLGSNQFSQLVQMVRSNGKTNEGKKILKISIQSMR